MKKVIKLVIKSKSIKATKSIREFKSNQIRDISVENITITQGNIVSNIIVQLNKDAKRIQLCKKIHRYLDNRDKKYVELIVA